MLLLRTYFVSWARTLSKMVGMFLRVMIAIPIALERYSSPLSRSEVAVGICRIESPSMPYSYYVYQPLLYKIVAQVSFVLFPIS